MLTTTGTTLLGASLLAALLSHASLGLLSALSTAALVGVLLALAATLLSALLLATLLPILLLVALLAGKLALSISLLGLGGAPSAARASLLGPALLTRALVAHPLLRLLPSLLPALSLPALLAMPLLPTLLVLLAGELSLLVVLGLCGVLATASLSLLPALLLSSTTLLGLTIPLLGLSSSSLGLTPLSLGLISAPLLSASLLPFLVALELSLLVS